MSPSTKVQERVLHSFNFPLLWRRRYFYRRFTWGYQVAEAGAGGEVNLVRQERRAFIKMLHKGRKK